MIEIEIELKFQVPAGRRAALRRALMTKAASAQTLRALYFDTPDRRLAAAGMALRVRHDGRRWVQTLKVPTAVLHTRLEHEVARPAPPRGQALRADPALHAGTPAGRALAEALGDATSTLRVVHQTDVHRTLREVRLGGSVIAVTLDVGEIRAGKASLPVHEVEFELVRGSVADLIELSRRWVQRFGLWLDLRSKSERGDRLARGAHCGEAQRARPSVLTASMQPDAALRAMVLEALHQILRNAADLADGIGSAEQLHQMRVGLRRLREALRLFGAWSAAVDPGWPTALRELFTALGAARDRDALALSVLPLLRDAGAPQVELPAAAAAAPPEAQLRSPAVNRLYLDLLAFAAACPEPGPSHAPAPEAAASTDLAPRARSILHALHRRLARDARNFAALDDVARHRTRKRLKRLRYGVEFTAPLFAAKPMRKSVERLQAAQEALGLYNDLRSAEALYRALAERDGRAWFAVGWLVARSAALVPQAQRLLSRLTRLGPFRRRGG